MADNLFEAFKNDFSLRSAGLDELVSTAEVGCVDGAEGFVESCFNLTGVDEVGRFGEELVLFDHVFRLKEGPGEHEFPVPRDAFGLEGHDVEGVGIVDDGDFSLRGDGFGEGGEMLVGVREGGDGLDGWNVESLQFLVQGIAVVNHVVRSKVTDPLLCFGTGSGGDDSEVRQLLGELNHDGSNSTGGSDDEKVAGRGRAELKAIEENLPSGDGGQGEGGGLGETE